MFFIRAKRITIYDINMENVYNKKGSYDDWEGST